MELFLHQNGEQVGPYTAEQIIAMVASGSITRDDNVWREGLSDWQPIHTVINLPESPLPNRLQQPFRSTKEVGNVQEGRKRIEIPRWIITAILPVVTLVLGYFIGREHLKYQMRSEMRSAFSNVANAFSHGFKDIAPPRLSSPVGKIDDPSPSTSSILSEIHTAPTPEPLPRLMLGETHQSTGFVIRLDNAKIDTARVKDMMGNLQTGKSPDLILSFTFANTDERRILRFHPSNPFMGGNFQLRDDVDNVIRGVNYGYTSEPVGALTGSEDIAPQTSVTHVQLFSIPPPKTEYLILTVDLSCLGGEGKIEFKIPASSIAK